MRSCGRECSNADLAGIRRIAAGAPGRTRRAISRRVCEEFGWRKPDGGLKDMSGRVVLLRMQREGVVRLPAPRHRSRNAARSPRRTSQAEPEPPRLTSAGELRDLRLDLLASRGESRLGNEYVDRYHSLGYPPRPGAQLRSFARAEGRLLALFGCGAAAWKTAPRDRCIGWTPQQRAQRLHLDTLRHLWHYADRL